LTNTIVLTILAQILRSAVFLGVKIISYCVCKLRRRALFKLVKLDVSTVLIVIIFEAVTVKETLQLLVKFILISTHKIL